MAALEKIYCRYEIDFYWRILLGPAPKWSCFFRSAFPFALESIEFQKFHLNFLKKILYYLYLNLSSTICRIIKNTPSRIGPPPYLGEKQICCISGTSPHFRTFCKGIEYFELFYFKFLSFFKHVLCQIYILLDTSSQWLQSFFKDIQENFTKEIITSRFSNIYLKYDTFHWFALLTQVK